ncbi:uncharacterized protein BO97DRAFT_416893 [Aspergillus homomorphus CBS 101889]|uniref:Uncharacterized protein n=1 Tax=Aspergillus homomorphus (strain CBS 101889) TaxID=1450537 RepID=A0A395HQ51_ASPHC|nr:hypothetical protein BO97DRAFT_416893 [Aspergillus homomorphus CBS 101889]RAL09405.1 hypothetical protein BO97DRAFT_416893 [Aspergillus homomorphus CBS 101889]
MASPSTIPSNQARGCDEEPSSIQEDANQQQSSGSRDFKFVCYNWGVTPHTFSRQYVCAVAAHFDRLPDSEGNPDQKDPDKQDYPKPFKNWEGLSLPWTGPSHEAPCMVDNTTFWAQGEDPDVFRALWTPGHPQMAVLGYHSRNLPGKRRNYMMMAPKVYF